MKLRWRLLTLTLAVSSLPGVVMADQLDGFRGFVAPALTLSAVVSLVIQGVGLLTFDTRFGKVFTFLLGLAGALWSGVMLNACLEGWPRDTDTTSYKTMYVAGLLLNITSILLGVGMVGATLRSAIRRTPKF